MFTLNEDLSIYATRGDIVFFTVTAEDNGKPYQFKAGDVLRIKVYEKKNAENVVLQKDFPVVMLETPDVGIYLTAEDTKIGDVISKHKDYWYEVELNPETAPQTIIGYDEDGAKLFRLFPEGADIPPYEPIKPEDIPIVDDKLDLTSTRPVENQAVARAIVALQADYDATKETVLTATADTAEAISVERSRIDNLIAHDDVIVNQALEYVSGASDKYDATITSDGVCATIKVNLREANLFIAGGTHNVFFIPDECRPIDVGRFHTEYGMAFDIRYDNDSNRYVLAMGTEVEDEYAPTQACVATFSYALADYELKDIRVGADGATYATAGEAVREQIGWSNNNLHSVLFWGELNPKTFTDNVALSGSGIPTTTSANYVSATCKIPVHKGTCVSVIGEHIGRLCLYNLADEVIPESYLGNYTAGKTATVHQDGYLRFTIVTEKGNELYQPKEAVKVRVTKLNRNNLITPRVFGSQYLYEPSYNIGLTENYIVAAEGVINNNGHYCLTDFIPVEPLDVLSISHGVPTAGAFYDENKNWVKAIQSGVEGVAPLTVRVPYNAVYARFNVKKDIATNYSVVYGEEAKETPESGIVYPWFMRNGRVSKWSGAAFCTLGDSITWQDGKAYGQGDVGEIARGYQTVIKEKLNTASYGNYGVSGAPVANGSKNGEGTVAKAQTVDYANYDLCIIAGGTNDFRLDVPIGEIGDISEKSFDDTTFFGAYRKMVEHILTQKPTIHICLFTPLHRNNAGYSVYSTNNAGHKLIEYVNAIKAIGEMYSLPVCDVYSNSGINTLNLSVYTMDGLHPNDKGYERMGEYCAAFLETI